MAWLRWFAALTLVVLACGEAAMAADEYFAGVESARAGFTQAIDDVEGRFVAQLAAAVAELERQFDLSDPAQVEEYTRRATEASVEATAAFVSAQAEGLERYRSDLSLLRPPEEAAEAHSASLDALAEARDGLLPTLEAVRAVTAVDDLASQVDSSPVGQALVRVDEACRVLQSVAIEQGLVVDLRCPVS